MLIKYKKNHNIQFTVIDDILVNIGIITQTLIINIQLWLDEHIIIIETSGNNIIRLKTEFFPKNNEILLDIDADSVRLIINDIEEFVFEDIDIISINTDCNHLDKNTVYVSQKYINEIIIDELIDDITDSELDELIDYMLLL